MVAYPGRIDIDHRIGGAPRRYFRFDERPLMQVPDEMRKCAAFLLCKQGGSFHPVGTVFFVGTATTDVPQMGHLYAVTAKHVIDKIQESSDDMRVYFRLNSLDSDVELAGVNIEDWYFHPNDSTTDVAVLPVDLENVDYLAYPVSSFVTDEVIKEEGIGIGDEVFLTGLFVHHTGKRKNIPILRVGNIAAMLEEPISTEKGLMEAYLIEARSIGGLSGSPVFVHLGLIRSHKEETAIAKRLEGLHFLLGLMHGHWDLPIPNTDGLELDQAYNKSINMGIGIVVPAKKILETINHPELEKMRMEREVEREKRRMPTLDAIDVTQDEKLFTKADFEDALKKVSQPKSDEETP